MTATWRTHVAADITGLWEDYRPTTLMTLPELARRANVGRVIVKNEGERPLGNFKALGGMVAGLRALARAAGPAAAASIPLPRLICASDGNHGLAVAAAARRAGTKASIYLPASVSRARAKRIETLGGEITWVDGTYDDAVAAAAAAARGAGLLIPDTTDDPTDPVVGDIMAGYALMTREIAAQLGDGPNERPSHVFLQAGVGGLAAAVAEGLHGRMREPKAVAVVEPESAACVARALDAGRPMRIDGNLHTAAEMLSCGLVSTPALKVLQQHHARSVLVSDDELRSAVSLLRESGGPATTPSGAAGLAGFMRVAMHVDLRAEHGLDADSCVLLVITEAPIAD